MNLKTETSQPFVPLSLFGGNGPAFTLQLNVNGAATVEQKLDVASDVLGPHNPVRAPRAKHQVR